MPYRWRIDLTPSTNARARRGRPRSLTEEQIVDAAVELARAMPLEDVSMRALAQHVGVPVMTIYNYVANKDALYELVLNHVLRPVQVPEPDEGPWEERLKQLERDARSALGEFPGLSFERRESAEGTRLAEGVMSILASAGFTPPDASLAFVALFTFMVGQIDIDVDVARAGGPAAAAVESTAHETQLSRDEIFEFGFDALIEGLKAKLEPRSVATTNARTPGTPRGAPRSR
jgi:TetR/AcrR family tetracycline transcriptional repressor